MEDMRRAVAEFEAIRKSGATNMFDRRAVWDIAFFNGFDSLLDIIEAGKYTEILSNYSRFIGDIEEDKVPEVEV